MTRPPRSFPKTPHCKGCGTAIAPGTDYCPTCKDRMGRGQSPEFQMHLGRTRRPPYEKPPAVNPGETHDNQ